MVGRVEVAAKITKHKKENRCTAITYPQVEGLKNKAVQAKINEAIQKQILALIPPEGCAVYAEIFGKYRVELNKNGILSLTLQFYTIRKQAANGLNMQKSITVNLENGKIYKLYELFKRDSDYLLILNKMIEQQIKEKNLHLIKKFKGITDYQDYFLKEHALIIYFQELEYTIHAEGIPEFVIPYFKIRNIISEQVPAVFFQP